MFKLKFLIGGKEVNTSSEMRDALTKVVDKKMEEAIRERLSPLKDELDAEQAAIEIDLRNGKISISNISEDLKQKITKALQKK